MDGTDARAHLYDTSMPYNVCQIIFSTNRIEFLSRTLEAQDNLNFEGCNVEKIFIDDYPNDRNTPLIRELVKSFGYNEIYLHEKNQGLSATWSEFWNLIKDRDYDYIWHQEDDVEVLEPIKVIDLIDLLVDNKSASQVVLKRQPWYDGEKESLALDTDTIFKQYRYERGELSLFSPIASLYSFEKVRYPYHRWSTDWAKNDNLIDINFNEGFVGLSLAHRLQLHPILLKNNQGNNLIRHIGDYFQGKRVLENEPGYENFAGCDPNKKYNSRTGQEYK